ncbi:MAG: DAK2 domain-containing protein [Clostridia bacterium]|nr:DAK2 domain-containing protein [Clostridia bacterium]
MSIARVDGFLMARMLQNGLNHIRSHEAEINKLNVFPVADGDTGTNMRLTLENGLKYADKTPEIGRYLCSVSNGMLLGARGNSGVILSQLFKGVYQELSRADTVCAADLRNGFIRGYRVAYQSVIRPVEGTILTVAREGVENIRRQIGRSTSVDTFFSMYVAEMRKTLSYTPEMLDVLKSAGVVDSGAAGYVLIVEGMLKFLRGEILDGKEVSPAPVTAAPAPDLDLNSFNETSAFEDGYCMEFLLQLMKQPGYLQNFRIDDFTAALSLYGESLVAVQDGKRVKVHIHTKTPAKIISCAQQYGEFVTFKLENMQIQHNERIRKLQEEKPRKPLAVIASADGEGITQLLYDLGCDVVIDGGPTMNTSTEEFLEAIGSVNADHIVIMPDNKNTIGAAKQAKLMYDGQSAVTVLRTGSMVEAYFALAMDVRDSKDTDFRVSQMKAGLEDTHTLAAATASKAYSSGGLEINAGECIAIADGEIVCGSRDLTDVVIEGLRRMPETANASGLLVFRGADVPEEDEDTLADALSGAFPDLEVSIVNGGQHLYHWLIGLMN